MLGIGACLQLVLWLPWASLLCSKVLEDPRTVVRLTGLCSQNNTESSHRAAAAPPPPLPLFCSHWVCHRGSHSLHGFLGYSAAVSKSPGSPTGVYLAPPEVTLKALLLKDFVLDLCMAPWRSGVAMVCDHPVLSLPSFKKPKAAPTGGSEHSTVLGAWAETERNT